MTAPERGTGTGDGRAPRQPSAPAAPLARSEDVARRRRVYTIQMAVRTVCFITLPFLPGWWKMAALAGALVLPYVAVLMANDPALEGEATDGTAAAARYELPAPAARSRPAPTLRVMPDGTVEHVEPENESPGGAR